MEETTSTPAAPPQVMTSVQDARARIFGRKREPRFELRVIDGAEFALVVPNEGVRGEIQQAAIDVDKNGRVRPGNTKKKLSLVVVAMVHTVIIDQGSNSKRPGAPVFAAGDVELLLKDQGGPDSMLSLYGPACEAVLDAADQAEEVAAKNG